MMKNIFVKSGLVAFICMSLFGSVFARDCEWERAKTNRVKIQAKAASCKRAQSSAELNVNNVRALINAYGNMWYTSLMADTFNAVFDQTREQLRGIDLGAYEDVVFISKSVGTVAAAKYAVDHGVNARQVFYTPLEQTFDYAGEGTKIVFFGDHDPWIVFDTIKQLCESHDFRHKVIPDGNHSLETGRTYDDADNIGKIIRETGECLFG